MHVGCTSAEAAPQSTRSHRRTDRHRTRPRRWLGLRLGEQREAEAATPMDIEWADGFAYASIGEGQILRLTVDGDAVEREMLVDGLAYPRGIALAGGHALRRRARSASVREPASRAARASRSVCRPRRTASGQILEQSDGRILAFPITADGLGEPSVLVDGLHFVNADHGLNDLDLGPDGMLYLSVGNLDRLAWDDGGDPPSGRGDGARSERSSASIRRPATSRPSPPDCATSSA